MIISISGKKQSGKDIIGKIIQTLIWECNEPSNNMLEKNVLETPIEEFVKTNLIFCPKGWRGFCNVGLESGWNVKKFADSLKEIICILIGCTREQLEDEKFKNTELGEDWRIWKFVLDEDANMFDGMCQLTNVIFSSREDAESYINEHKIINVLDIITEILTPRILLQTIGTEAGRNIVHPNIWINALFAKYKNKVIQRPVGQDTYYVDNFPKWIITDVRFMNEVEKIQDKKGILIRVNRDVDKIYPEIWKQFTLSSIYNEKLKNEYNEKLFIKWLNTVEDEKLNKLGKLLTHDSEILLDDFEGFDYVIDNNGTIEELIEQIKLILIEEKII